MASLLVSVLRDPGQVTRLSLEEWDLLVRQARRTNLLARLAIVLDEHGRFAAIPEQPRRHLDSVRLLADKQHRDIRWEVRSIRRALRGTAIPVILLKGAAYVMEGLSAARGRLVSDLDILVPRDDLPDTEQALMIAGWQSSHLDKRDQRYYRKWMHELPPLKHMRRLSVLDVHHTLVPLTSRYHFDATPLFTDARVLEKAATPVDSDLLVLSREDMVIHSAVHLFCDGEFDHGLRDLADLDDLVREFSQTAGFWEALQGRARTLRLGRPVFYAMRYLQRILGTPVPEALRDPRVMGGPNRLIQGVMDFLFMRALEPDHPSCDRSFTALARWVLYVRAHYLRMPLHLLLPHLLGKVLRRDESPLADVVRNSGE